MSIIYQRQNEKIALTYLMASDYCFSKERRLKYLMIFISILLMATGIFYKFGLNISDDLRDFIVGTNKYLTFISGLYVVGSIFLARAAKNIQKEAINILELYDNYVFNLPVNKTIMKSLNMLTINHYAEKRRKKQFKYLSHYFKTEKETDNKNVVFNHYQNKYKDSINMMNRVTGLYYFIWISFIVLIFLLAVYIDDTFVESLSNILIPSLSAITLIFGSWYTMIEDKTFLHKVIKDLSDIEEEAQKGDAKLQSPLLLRSLQDGMFAYRLRSFLIPNFLVRIYTKSMIREEKKKAVKELELKLQVKKLASENSTIKTTQTSPSKEKSEPKVTKIVDASKPRSKASVVKMAQTNNDVKSRVSVPKPIKTTTKSAPAASKIVKSANETKSVVSKTAISKSSQTATKKQPTKNSTVTNTKSVSKISNK